MCNMLIEDEVSLKETWLIVNSGDALHKTQPVSFTLTLQVLELVWSAWVWPLLHLMHRTKELLRHVFTIPYLFVLQTMFGNT